MKTIPILLLLVLCFQDIPGQETHENEVPLVNEIVYEKVYLHLDREIYAPRENIWFKAYLLSGITNKPIKGKKNVYVQLLNDTGKVVMDRLLLAVDGTAAGDLKIPYVFEEGKYTIRAYTKYLENFGEESFFIKQIWITNRITANKDGHPFATGLFDAGFYPEGGNLVLNAANTVAFKVMDSRGRGISAEGYVINDLGDTLTPFETSFLGMGSFVMMPRPGRSYYAVFREVPSYRYEFGKAYPDLVAMHFEDQNDRVRFTFARNFSRNIPEDFRLIARHKGIELFTEELHLGSYSEEIILKKERFPLGISMVSLVDREGRTVSERLVFIQAGLADNIKISSEKKNYENRELLRLNISSLMDSGEQISGGLSLAIVNRNYLLGDYYQSSLRSYLLIDSELKGPIESSAFYFTEGRMKPSQKLDLLMMVQGWRSYYWPDIIAKIPKDLKGWNDVGLTVTGKVTRLFKPEPIEGAEVKLGPFSSSFIMLDTLTDENGMFTFDRVYLKDGSKLIVQAVNERGRPNTEVYLKDLYKPVKNVDIAKIKEIEMKVGVPPKYNSDNFTKLEAERRYAIESGSYWLEEVEVKIEAPLSISDYMRPEVERMVGMPDKTITITDEDYSYLNIFDYLESNPVAGVTVVGNSIKIRNGLTPVYRIDGMINSELDVANVPMGDIDYVDIIKSGFGMALMGSRGGNGMLAIYTNTGSWSDFNRYVKGRASATVSGYQWPKQYYSPKYELESNDSEVPDYRPTLYWEPYVLPENGTAELEFYTSDFNTEYVVLLEGVTDSGKVCAGKYTFTVGKGQLSSIDK